MKESELKNSLMKSMSNADIEKRMKDLAFVIKLYHENGWKPDRSYQGAVNTYTLYSEELNTRDHK